MFLLAEASSVVSLQITVGQFISAIIFIITAMVSIFGFLIKNQSQLNSLKNEMGRQDERVKSLEENRNDNKSALNEIKETLNKVNVKVEVLLSKVNMRDNDN